VYNISDVKPEGKYHLADLGIEGRILLEWILENMVWSGLISLKTGTSGGLL
jgi:hypothetical protein